MNREFFTNSKKMWAFIASSASFAAYVVYDRHQASNIFKTTSEKCKLMGNEPALDNSLVTLKIVAAGMTDEEVRAKIVLFRRYFAKWLTLAGVDYKMTTFTPEESSNDEESLANSIFAAAGNDNIPVDSFTHNLLTRKPEATKILTNSGLGCDPSSNFLERCARFFNQRKLVHSLSDNVLRILGEASSK